VIARPRSERHVVSRECWSFSRAVRTELALTLPASRGSWMLTVGYKHRPTLEDRLTMLGATGDRLVMLG